MSEQKILRQPGLVFWFYLLACCAFAVLTIRVNGPRFPSSALFVAFLTGLALAWTLDVLVRYATDTRTIATASMRQATAAMEQTRAAHEQREREDRQALGGIALLLFDYAHGKTMPFDTVNDQQRYRWGILTKIAETVLSIEDTNLIPLCAKISRFVIQAGYAFHPDEAIRLFEDSARLANPALIEEYEHQESARKAGAGAAGSV